MPLGLRGVASVGSGLRTGVTVVNHAIRTAAELEEARARAREAVAEQARLEREAAAAEDAARQGELRRTSEGADDAAPAAEPRSASGVAADPTGLPDDAATSATIRAAVTAGEAGDVAPRGTFLDVSI